MSVFCCKMKKQTNTYVCTVCVKERNRERERKCAKILMLVNQGTQYLLVLKHFCRPEIV